MKATVEKMDERIKKAKEELGKIEGKKNAEYRSVRKKLKRLQRKKNRNLAIVKTAEEKSKVKKKGKGGKEEA